MPSSIADVLFAKNTTVPEKENTRGKIDRSEEKNSFSSFVSKAIISKEENGHKTEYDNSSVNARKLTENAYQAKQEETSSDNNISEKKGLAPKNESPKEEVNGKDFAQNEETAKENKAIVQGDTGAVAEIDLSQKQVQLLQEDALNAEINASAALLEEMQNSDQVVTDSLKNQDLMGNSTKLFAENLMFNNNGVAEEANSGSATARTPALVRGEPSISSLVPEAKNPTPKIANNKLGQSLVSPGEINDVDADTENTVRVNETEVEDNTAEVQVNIIKKEIKSAQEMSVKPFAQKSVAEKTQENKLNTISDKVMVTEQKGEEIFRNASRGQSEVTDNMKNGSVETDNTEQLVNRKVIEFDVKNAQKNAGGSVKEQQIAGKEGATSHGNTSQKDASLNKEAREGLPDKSEPNVKVGGSKEKIMDEISSNLLKQNDNVMHNLKAGHQVVERMATHRVPTQTGFNEIVSQTVSKVEHFQSVIENIDRYVLSMVKEPSGKTITVTLIPEYLGKVVLSCKEEGTRVVVEIQAENNMVREMLQKEEATIKSMLEQNGFKLSQFDVHTKSEQQARNNERNFEGREEYDGATQRRNEAKSHNAQPTKTGTAATGRRNGFWWVA